MPDVQEVFRMATQEVRPDKGFVERQLDHQRRRARDRRNGAIALVAAVAALALVAAFFVVRNLPRDAVQPASEEQPSPPVDEITFPYVATVQPAIDVPLVEFRSGQYGYTIAYPEIWSVRAATKPLNELEEPLDIHPTADYFSRTAPDRSDPGLLVAAQSLDPGTKLREWRSKVETFVDPCGPPATRETVRVGGEKATLAYLQSCTGPPFFIYWTTVVHDGTGYHIIWWGNTGDEARDRAVLDRILASFAFSD